MYWNTALFFLVCVIIIVAISFWLRSNMRCSNGRDSLPVQLAVLGFVLVTSGTALQLNHEPTYPPAIVTRLIEAFGALFVVSGVVILFILFCISRGMPTIIKPTSERENPMGEYLR